MSDPHLQARIRQWMLRMPRPAHVRVHTANSVDVELFTLPDRPRWSDVAGDLASMHPTKLVALGDSENVLRVLDVEETNGQAQAAEQASEVHDIAIPAPLSSDPQVQLLTHIANLLARAHEVSQRNNASFTTRMLELVINRADRMEERLERAEASYRNEFESRVLDQLNQVEDTDQRAEMMRLFFGASKQPPTPEASPPPAGDGLNGRAPKGWS